MLWRKLMRVLSAQELTYRSFSLLTRWQRDDLARMLYDLSHDPETRSDLAKLIARKFPERVERSFFDVLTKKEVA